MQQGRGVRTRLIDNLDAAKSLFAPVLARAREERLYIAHLDAASRLVGIRIRYAGAGGPVEFPVRDIIADAVGLGSLGLVLAHNHPSGDPSPSPTDIETTRALVRVARPIGIAVRDHLVFGGGRCVSFREHGLL